MAFFSNTLAVIRQHIASAVGDLIMGTPDSGSTTTCVDIELGDIRWTDDYFNEHGYRFYVYAGTNIGEERFVTDWVQSTHTLTLAPVHTAAIDTTSKYELHYKFTANEYLQAINVAIESLAKNYLIDIKDESTIKLTSAEDNLEDTVYTWEYSLPTSMLYIYRVIPEHTVSGIKLTGTVSGAFTEGETVTGGTSGATGECSYGPAAGTYIRVRKVSGTFVVGETATGGTSSKTCSAITAVDSEPAGDGTFQMNEAIDPRLWQVIKSYAPKLKLDEDRYLIDEDLYIRIEGQGAQPRVTADTDVIYLPPDWIVNKAITKLPYSKIITHNLQETVLFAKHESEKEPRVYPHPKAVSVI